MATEITMWSTAIKAARRRMGLTQSEFAQVVDCRQVTVSDWERGKYEPSDDMKALLVVKCGIDPKDVVPDWIRTYLLETAA